MKKKLILSNNFSRNVRSKKDIIFIIIHYTGMQSEIESINRLRDQKSKVSCHYFITKAGEIIQMIEEKKIAWHAGKSKWKNYKNLNKNSIGIELANPGHKFGYENFSVRQINSLIKLCKYLKRKFKINKENFLGHSDIAPLRKVDPGEKFPWKKLSKFNLGTWYSLNKINLKIKKKKTRELFFNNLFRIGYRYFKKNKIDKNDKSVIKAFQRRYLPKNVSGKIDTKTLKISHFLANQNNFS